MPMYDRRCEDCGHEEIDCWEPVVTHMAKYCPQCYGFNMPRVWSKKAAGVIPDGIPGGVWIKNGLCNSDGSPRRYDSHTDINKEAAKRGLVNHVTHMGAQGGDRSKHTSRWT